MRNTCSTNYEDEDDEELLLLLPKSIQKASTIRSSSSSKTEEDEVTFTSELSEETTPTTTNEAVINNNNNKRIPSNKLVKARLMNMTSTTSGNQLFLGFFGTAFMLVFFVTTLLASSTQASSSSSNEDDDGYLNVYGEPLQSCSSDGMALTGYTRNGYCIERTDDKGSHHICIDLSSTSSNENGYNFCQVTGQSNWCAYDNMACHEDSSQLGCPVTNWCVCQWAFSSYVLAEGCDQIQTIVCDAINLEAVLAYQKIAAQPNWGYGGESKYQLALECIVDRCGLDINNLPGGRRSSTFFSSIFNYNNSSSWINLIVAGGIAGIAFALYAAHRRRRNNKTEDTTITGGTATASSGSYLLSK